MVLFFLVLGKEVQIPTVIFYREKTINSLLKKPYNAVQVITCSDATPQDPCTN